MDTSLISQTTDSNLSILTALPNLSNLGASLESANLGASLESANLSAPLESANLSALPNLSNLSVLHELAHLSVLQKLSLLSTLQEFSNLSVSQSFNLSALHEQRRSNLSAESENSVETIFLKTCQQAFREQQIIQSSTEHNEASTSESFVNSPINLPNMDNDEMNFEIASTDKISAEFGQFSANYDRDKEFRGWIWYCPNKEHPLKKIPISLPAWRQGINMACGNNTIDRIQQPQVLYRINPPLHHGIKRPLHDVPIANFTSVSIRIGAMDLGLDRTLRQDLLNESEEFLAECVEENIYNVIRPLSEVEAGNVATSRNI